MTLEKLIGNLKFEYTYDFLFKSFRTVSKPSSDSLLRIKTRYYYGTKAFMKRKVREHDNPALAKRGVHVIEYKDAFFRSAVALRFDVPTFDSGDRQYDSRHTLYLFHSLTDVSAVYCKEGYEIAELYILDTLKAVSAELHALLSGLGFPMKRIKAL